MCCSSRFRKIEGLDLDRAGGLQAYLRQAILNRIRDEFRKFKRRPDAVELESAQPDEGPSPLEAAIGRQALDRYEAALAGTAARAIARRSSRASSWDSPMTRSHSCWANPPETPRRMAVERALVRLIERLRA